jgi:hypothetical protein
MGWRLVPLCALLFTAAWFVGHYSGDAGNDFTRSRVLTVRIAPDVVAMPPHLRVTAEDIQRALRDRRAPIIILRKKP